MLGIATVTYIPVLVNHGCPSKKQRKEIRISTYIQNKQSMLTKQQINETIQLLTREKVAP